jgi:hypothetical protein
MMSTKADVLTNDVSKILGYTNLTTTSRHLENPPARSTLTMKKLEQHQAGACSSERMRRLYSHKFAHGQLDLS